MIVVDMEWDGLQLVITASLFFVYFMFFFFILKSLPYRNKPWLSVSWRQAGSAWRIPPLLSSLLQLQLISADSRKEREQLLREGGFHLNGLMYFACKRLLIGLMIVGWLVLRMPGMVRFLPDDMVMIKGYLNIVLLLLLPFVWFDKTVLVSLAKRRKERITKEVYALCHHFLYYSGSRMNLHAKLTRCIPYTRTIRQDVYVLIGEWYQHPDRALERFKERLGTEEGISFAETLRALRLSDSEEYYQLLRQRIQDYKEKLELAKEGRKETVSYLLFVIAGIPILHTYRIFIYPWVAEGQKLFQMMN